MHASAINCAIVFETLSLIKRSIYYQARARTHTHQTKKKLHTMRMHFTGHAVVKFEMAERHKYNATKMQVQFHHKYSYVRLVAVAGIRCTTNHLICRCCWFLFYERTYFVHTNTIECEREVCGESGEGGRKR